MSISDRPVVPVVLCGGMGSRLWPLSRKQYPKQFLKLGNLERSLLQDTIARVEGREFMKPVVVTNIEHRFLVAEQIHSMQSDCDIILEPDGRNTAAAITAAAEFVNSKYRDANMLVLPSDHLIRDNAAFLEAVNSAVAAANEGALVTFGITPEYPETGYGYIKAGEHVTNAALKVDAFVEKPNLARAEEYVRSGEFFWNSGMFVLPSRFLLEEMNIHEPEVVSHVKRAFINADIDSDFIRLSEQSFMKAPSISIDYAVMERSERVVTIPVDCKWSDAGTWDSLWRNTDKDASGNAIIGESVVRDTENCYIRCSEGPSVAALGVENLTIISTADMVLVADQAHSQDVKALMEDAAAKNKNWVNHHTKVHRPWGFYQTIDLAPRHQVKYIHVNPNERLSIQMHHHRAEHWVIVSGTAKVTVGESDSILSENQYIYIPLGEVHCIENIGKMPLTFIEVQHGSYLGEDDIVRFDDRYGRVVEVEETIDDEEVEMQELIVA